MRLELGEGWEEGVEEEEEEEEEGRGKLAVICSLSGE